MKRSIELISDVAVNRQCLSEKIFNVESEATQWQLWRPDEDLCTSVPDISIIDVSNMRWPQIAKLANSCLGKVVAIWGIEKSVCGLPVLPLDFAGDDLFQLLVDIANKPAVSWRESLHSRAQWNFPVTVPVSLDLPV